MNLFSIVKQKNISAYKLSKLSNVPYMTINDIINGKTLISNCNAETVYKIAKALDTTVEKLIEPCLIERPSFEIYKSAICHKLKELGDIDFLIDTLENCEIINYFALKWYPECLYLLAMFDYISRISNIPLCSEYDKFRKYKLSGISYPSGIIILDLLSNCDKAKKEAFENAIPEFKRFNIVENEVRNVV